MVSIAGMSNMYQQMNNLWMLNSWHTQGRTQLPMLSMPWMSPILIPMNVISIHYHKPADSQTSAEMAAFATRYQDGMSEMDNLANSLRELSGKHVLNDKVVSTSDVKIADVSSTGELATSGTYSLTIKQLAAAQNNHTQELASTGTDLKGQMQLNTAKGTFNFQADAALSNNQDALSALADQINKAEAGVTAFVESRDGKSVLSLSANKTGESSAFQVTGDLAVQTGLNTVATSAQNAIYTVKKDGLGGVLNRSSETNSVMLEAGTTSIQAALKSVGTADIQVSTDYEKIAGAVSKLVQTYNSNLQLLADNAGRGLGVRNQASRMRMDH